MVTSSGERREAARVSSGNLNVLILPVNTMGAAVCSRLPPSVPGFSVPAGWLRSGVAGCGDILSEGAGDRFGNVGAVGGGANCKRVDFISDGYAE